MHKNSPGSSNSYSLSMATSSVSSFRWNYAVNMTQTLHNLCDVKSNTSNFTDEDKEILLDLFSNNDNGEEDDNEEDDEEDDGEKANFQSSSTDQIAIKAIRADQVQQQKNKQATNTAQYESEGAKEQLSSAPRAQEAHAFQSSAASKPRAHTQNTNPTWETQQMNAMNTPYSSYVSKYNPLDKVPDENNPMQWVYILEVVRQKISGEKSGVEGIPNIYLEAVQTIQAYFGDLLTHKKQVQCKTTAESAKFELQGACHSHKLSNLPTETRRAICCEDCRLLCFPCNLRNCRCEKIGYLFLTHQRNKKEKYFVHWTPQSNKTSPTEARRKGQDMSQNRVNKKKHHIAGDAQNQNKRRRKDRRLTNINLAE